MTNGAGPALSGEARGRPIDSRRCTVCGGETRPFDEAPVLGKYAVTYHRCATCGVVVAPDPYWLDEAYASPITAEDVGLLRRSRVHARLVEAVVRTEKLHGGRFLDWAGGYGTLAQLMRDKGRDFWHSDPYTPAIFARGFRDDGTGTYDLITAFEVLEHLPDPVASLRSVASRADLMLLSTTLLPEPAPRVSEWWYYAPDAGQHVTLHTEESLRHIAAHLDFQLTTNGVGWHLFHRKPLALPTRLLLSTALTRGGLAVRDRLRRT